MTDVSPYRRIGTASSKPHIEATGPEFTSPGGQILTFLPYHRCVVTENKLQKVNIESKSLLACHQNTMTRRYKGPHQSYDAKSSSAAHGARSQVSSQSSGSPLGHTHLPQQSQYSGIFAHKLNPQARPEQLKLSKTDPSTWS
jgi:hypothetical protein